MSVEGCRKCTRCGIVKDLSEFYTGCYMCKECDRINQKRRRDAKRPDDTEIRKILKDAIIKDSTFAVSDRYTINVRSIYYQNSNVLESKGFDRSKTSRKISDMAKENGFIRTGEGKWTRPDGFNMEDFKW